MKKPPMLALKIPPPVQLVIAAALMWLCAKHTPTYAYALSDSGFAEAVLAGLCAADGVVLLVLGAAQFWRAGTTINPMDPSRASRLVTEGVHRISRNPMYLGELLLLIAWGIFLGNMLAMFIPPLFALSITYLQILPEEDILRQKFSKEYEEYCQNVRRWL